MEFGYTAEIKTSVHDDEIEINVAPDYRTLPITEGFDWPTIFKDIAATRSFDNTKTYLVVFRSVRKASADGEHIRQLDQAAHEEAKQSPGLLHYFADDVDDDGRALSWCLWTDKQFAREALHGPAHADAVRHAPDFYEEFPIELYDLYVIEDEVVFDGQRMHV